MKKVKTYWFSPVYKKRTYKYIIDSVLLHYGITELILRSETRLRRVVDARKVIGYLLHVKLGMSSTEVGNLINRDHATVLHYRRYVESQIILNRKYKEHIYSFI